MNVLGQAKNYSDLHKPTFLQQLPVTLQGTLRVLLVLLHDFPEFLCEYHFQLCNVIPPSCIQMRNLILSAFPRNMRLPDPFTPNLKVDLLPEINQSPRFVPEPHNLLPPELRYCLLTPPSTACSQVEAALCPLWARLVPIMLASVGAVTIMRSFLLACSPTTSNVCVDVGEESIGYS